MDLSPRLLAAAGALLALPVGAADIVRCLAASGAVTYQQGPCSDASREQAVRIATDYPPPNLAERDRLLQREAALYQRLEARRERESREVVLREARLAREAEVERERLAEQVAQPPQLAFVLPPRGLRYPGPRHPVRRTGARYSL